MDPADPRARRVAAAARSPFPALQKYARQALKESDQQESVEDVPYEFAPAEPDPSYHEYHQQPEPEPEQEFMPPPPPPRTAPRRDAAPQPAQWEPGPAAAPARHTEPSERPLRQDLLLGTAVAFLAFVLVRPLVLRPAAEPAPSVTPWALTDRSGGVIEAAVGAPVAPVESQELAVEIPLPDATPAAPPVSIPAPAAPAAPVASAPAPSVAAPPSIAAPPPKRVGVWLTVQSPQELAQIYTALAKHHLERENWDQARYFADKVLSTWPENTEARKLRELARNGSGVAR